MYNASPCRPLFSTIAAILFACGAVLAPHGPPRAVAAPAPFTAAQRQHWSLQPVKNPQVPAVAHRDRVRTPVDAFVLKQLESRQLTFSPPASRAELLRRVKFDLLGLPPTPAEIDQFERDRTEHAYERLVDRLLADPALRRIVGPGVARPRPLRRDGRLQPRPRPPARLEVPRLRRAVVQPKCAV